MRVGRAERGLGMVLMWRVHFLWGWRATQLTLVFLVGYFRGGTLFGNCKNIAFVVCPAKSPMPARWSLGKSQLSLLKSRPGTAFFSINCWMAVLMDPNSASAL